MFSRRINFKHSNIKNASDEEVESESDENQIRKWGCNRTETPFIFVHIGKEGVGTIRSAIAFGARNVTKKKFHLKDDSFYLIDDNGTHAYFVNSDRARAVPYFEKNSFEDTIPCEATTPLGLIGCMDPNQYMKGCDRLKDKICRHVYVGHNFIGNEMTWSTRHQLEQWYGNIKGDTNRENNSNTLFEFLDEILKKKSSSDQYLQLRHKNRSIQKCFS